MMNSILKSVQAELADSGLAIAADKKQLMTDGQYLAAHKNQLNYLFKTCKKYYEPGAKFLDIGSSFGYPCLGAKLIGYDAYGLDVPEMVAKFAARFKYFGIENIASDLSLKKSPFSSRKFDMILVSAIPESADYQATRFFGEVARLLKPGGVVIMAAANLLRFRHLAKILLSLKRHRQIKSKPSGDYYYEFAATELSYLLTKNGLNVEQVKYRNFNHAGSAWLGQKLFNYLSGLLWPHRKGNLVVTARK
ncbi:MAG: class I SAM-dependent methyltransferase [Patescibacteria group bacterium]